MSYIIAVANQKGGVGKTTTVVNLAASLAYKGLKILVVDLDPQGNTTTACGINKSNIEFGTYHVLLDKVKINEAIFYSEIAKFDVLPANRILADAEVSLVNEIARETRLQKALNAISINYDIILIDCPPSLTLLTINGLVASEKVLVPMLCEYYSLEGISDLLATIRKIKKSGLNSQIDLLGILRTMFDNRSNLSQEVSSQIEDYFKHQVLKTSIPRNIKLAESPSFGKPALYHDDKAKGVLAYLSLADEIIDLLYSN